MAFDTPTMFTMTLVNFALAALAALFVWYVNRPITGLGHLASGVGIIFFGFAFTLFLKPYLGMPATAFGNNTQILGMLILFHGIRRFRGLTTMPWWCAACLALPFALGQSWFALIYNDRAIRAAIISPFIASIMFAGAWSILIGTPRSDRFIHGVTAVALSLYGCIQVVRAIEAVLPGFGANAISTGHLPTLSLLLLNVCLIGCTFGMSTATNMRLRARIEKLAFCDALTELPNRRAFDSRLDRVHTRCISTGSPVALIYIDVDRFKAINDRFGHSAGDQALKQVAERLRLVAHPDDCLARMGGDEFVLLTERFSTRQHALTLVSQLTHQLHEPIDVSGTPIAFSSSCGLAFYPDHVTTTMDLVRRADAEMYVAKRAMPTLH